MESYFGFIYFSRDRVLEYW